MYNPEKLHDYARRLKHSLMVGIMPVDVNERAAIIQFADDLRHHTNLPLEEALVLTLRPAKLNAKTIMSLASSYWDQIPGLIPLGPVPKESSDWPRMVRLFTEINLLHLNLLNEDFEHGMKVRAEELSEISNLKSINLPLRRDENYRILLSYLGHTLYSKRAVRPFKGNAQKEMVVNLYVTPSQMADVTQLLTGPIKSVTDSNDELKFAALLKVAEINWCSIANITQVEQLICYRPATAEQSAELAYHLHRTAVGAPPEECPPWPLVNENYRSALAMLMEECYSWVQSGMVGPAAYSTERAITRLSGLPFPWATDLETDLGSRALLTAAMTLPPIQYPLHTLH